mmetsp:Transcript_33438/g.94669  ORF Transcript_33438/g.94669 Transcript_33438/m.94669 type:complete len:498 (+) Transcript_33438:368-1861(+)
MAVLAAPITARLRRTLTAAWNPSAASPCLTMSTSTGTPPASLMASFSCASIATWLRAPAAIARIPGGPLATALTRASMPPASPMACRFESLPLARFHSVRAASSATAGSVSPAAFIRMINGLRAPASAMASLTATPLLKAMLQSAPTAECCCRELPAPQRSISTRAGRAPAFMIATLFVLMVARLRRAPAAASRASGGPLSNSELRALMPPASGIRVLFELLSASTFRVLAAMVQHSGVCMVRRLTRASMPPTATMASLFLSEKAKLWRAPAAACRVLGLGQPSSATRAGMPPASATTAAFVPLTARSHRAKAAASAASGEGTALKTAISCSSTPPAIMASLLPWVPVSTRIAALQARATEPRLLSLTDLLRIPRSIATAPSAAISRAAAGSEAKPHNALTQLSSGADEMPARRMLARTASLSMSHVSLFRAATNALTAPAATRSTLVLGCAAILLMAKAAVAMSATQVSSSCDSNMARSAGRPFAATIASADSREW